MPLAIFVKSQREALSLTQSDVALEVDITLSYMQKIEQGARTPSIIVLEKLSQTLRLTQGGEDQLFRLAGHATRNSAQIRPAGLVIQLAAMVNGMAFPAAAVDGQWGTILAENDLFAAAFPGLGAARSFPDWLFAVDEPWARLALGQWHLVASGIVEQIRHQVSSGDKHAREVATRLLNSREFRKMWEGPANSEAFAQLTAGHGFMPMVLRRAGSGARYTLWVMRWQTMDPAYRVHLFLGQYEPPQGLSGGCG